jgi:transposase
MVAPSRCIRKPLRLIPVPWPDGHPEWLALDRQIPHDHRARLIRTLVEQLDLSALFDSFAGVGSAVTPPDLLLQVVLFQIQRHELAPTIWFRDSRESLPVRWLLRGLQPARSVFYRFRDHVPQNLVDTFNHQILSLAQTEGYTQARAASLDGTFQAAAGSRHRLLNRDSLEQRCLLLEQACAADDAGVVVAAAPPVPAPVAGTGVVVVSAVAPPVPAPLAGTEASRSGSVLLAVTLPLCSVAAVETATPAPAAAGAAAVAALSTPTPAAVADTSTPPPAKRPYWMAGSRQGRRRQHRRYQQARQELRSRLVNHDRKQRRQRKAKRRPAAKVKICPSEPEAVLGKDKERVFRPLYNTQILQDLDSPFVLGYAVCARTSDAGLLPPLLERGRQLTGRKLEELLSDGMYARLLDVRYCKEQGVQLYAPLPAPGAPAKGKSKSKNKGQEERIGKEQFTWLETEHTYRCPQGHVLHLESRCREKRREGEEEVVVVVEQYRCAPVHCQDCPLAERCTKRADKGRTVKRLEGQELLDEVGTRTQSAAGQARYRERKQTVELCHADFKQHRGLRRFPAFGLRLAQGLIALMVLAHNGLALLRAREAKQRGLQEERSRP